jgi:hypothetical protein
MKEGSLPPIGAARSQVLSDHTIGRKQMRQVSDDAFEESRFVREAGLALTHPRILTPYQRETEPC